MSGFKRGTCGIACALALALGGGGDASAAVPADPLFIFSPSQLPPKPPATNAPPPNFQNPCGVAVDAGSDVYVSDYYHHFIDVFDFAASLNNRFAAQARNVDPLDGPCGLAVAGGALYVNNYHRNVEKLVPAAGTPPGFASAGVIDAGHPTGVAVDRDTGVVYVDARTRINAYDTSGNLSGTIGSGTLGDGYGIAVSGYPATDGHVYVPDAATGTVRVYDPQVDVTNPVQSIDGSELPGGGFGSLQNSAVAVDDASGTIYVADTIGPQFSESPKATIHAFDAAGTYLGRLKQDVVDGSPVGLAVDNSGAASQGRIYVTSGNTTNGVLYAYPPGAAGIPPATLSAPSGGPATAAVAGPVLAAGANRLIAAGGKAGASSTIAQKGSIRVTVSGSLAPKRLPRHGRAPIAVTVGGRVSTTDGSRPPRLQSLRVEINRNGSLDPTGLPLCPLDAIQPASTQRALAACRGALVGRGTFEAEITLGAQEPYPARGTLLLFNGRRGGRRVLFGQIYSSRPFATSFVIVFGIQKASRGTYGTVLEARLPAALGSWGNLTGIEMTLRRRYSFRGRSRSYVSAGCPAPKGFDTAPFSLARTTFGFEGGEKLTSVLPGTCVARN